MLYTTIYICIRVLLLTIDGLLLISNVILDNGFIDLLSLRSCDEVILPRWKGKIFVIFDPE